MAPQLIIAVTPTQLTQILAETDNVSNWSFPIIYEVGVGSQAAQTAQINIGSTITPLKFGQPSQNITGSGSTVALNVDLGPNCEAVKIGANPGNQTDCSNPYPMISSFSADDAPDLFQIACAGETTSWNIVIDLELPPAEPETPPTSVSLFVDGALYEQLPSGQSSYKPSGTTLAFAIDNFVTGTVKIAYTLQAAAAAA